MIGRVLALAITGISVGVIVAQAPKPAPGKAAAKAPVTATKAKSGSSNYVPPKTPWGEPDLQGMWPLNHLIAVGLQRNSKLGTKAYLTDEEVAAAQGAANQRLAKSKTGALPVADASSKVMKQTSLIISPENGQFPELTDYGKKLQAEMKSSYRPGQTVFDNVDDFSSWDRCVTRGMPVSMEPRNYNNGVKITQSPGYVVIFVEMAHEARVIPTTPMPKLDPAIKTWLGESRGHWEGDTLVVETTNFNGLTGQTSAGVPNSPGPLQPETTNFKITERFTRTAPDTIHFEMKVEDPQVMKTPYTVVYDTYLDNTYEFFEYACHEGNTAVRNYIETSRFERNNKGKGK